MFFVPYNPSLVPDPAIIAAIEANGGRNDVVVVEMWALFGEAQYNQGRWGFFSPCMYDYHYAQQPAATSAASPSRPGVGRTAPAHPPSTGIHTGNEMNKVQC